MALFDVVQGDRSLPQSRTTACVELRGAGKSDSRFGLADTESGSAATRPASATLQKQARVRRCPGDGVVNAYALAWHLQPADHFSGSSGGEEASAAVSGDIGMYGSHTLATRGWRREQTSALPQT